MMRMINRLFLISVFSSLVLFASGQNDKVIRSCVIDSAYLLTDLQRQDLTTRIMALDDSIGSLRGEKIETYSLRTANAWGLGRKDVDDGVLITVALYDRMMRIEVGYGLELIIKDEIAARIIREVMAPNFRQEKYYEGLAQ